MNNIEIIKEQIEILRNMQDGTLNNTLQGCRMKIKLAKEIAALVLILTALQLDNDYSEVTQHNNESFEETHEQK